MISTKERDAFSFANLIRATESNKTRGSFEQELLHDIAQREGRAHDPSRMRVPWALLSRRDMSVDGVSGSQYLVGTDASAVVDALRPWSVAMQAGASVLAGLTGNVTIPRTTAGVTGEWLTGEHDPITASQPAVGQINLTPKTLASLTTYTKLLEKMAPQTEQFLRGHLQRVLGQTLDLAVLNGSGISGEPTGIANVPGVHAGTIDATATYSDLLAQLEAVSANGSEPTAVISTPAVRTLLAGRSRSTGGDTPIWDGARVVGVPAYATPSAPASKLYMGDFRQCVVAFWGSGFDLSIDPFTGWADGKITIRLMAHVDFAVLHPASFSVASVA